MTLARMDIFFVALFDGKYNRQSKVVDPKYGNIITTKTENLYYISMHWVYLSQCWARHWVHKQLNVPRVV